MTDAIRLGADIGGTFTAIALDRRGTMLSTSVLTKHAAPNRPSWTGSRCGPRTALSDMT